MLFGWFRIKEKNGFLKCFEECNEGIVIFICKGVNKLEFFLKEFVYWVLKIKYLILNVCVVYVFVLY